MTEGPTTLSIKELTMPGVKNNSFTKFTLGVVGQYTLIETFLWKFIDSILVLGFDGVQVNF